MNNSPEVPQENQEGIKDPEGFMPVELVIQEPRGDKNIAITFECEDVPNCSAYNRAVREIVEKAGFRPFLQSSPEPGTLGACKPGWYMYELWTAPTTEEVGAVLEEIQALAREKFRFHHENGFHDVWNEKPETM